MTATPCTQPGCPGSYGPEGYCDECGSRAAQPAAAPPATVATAGTGSVASASVSAPTGATSGPLTQSTRASGTQPFTGTRGRLGGGMKDIPPVPIRNPSEAVLQNPQVPENKRRCGKCQKPVGRTGPDGKPGRVQGFCPHCRTRFSFVPSLQHGDMVAARYEILGAMAHGGLGWIYLARDKNIGDDVAERWVVLKGLIDSNDPDAIDSAIAERRFLAALDHPNIVQIYDFVRHPDPRTNEPLSYIVMEYVPGKSLRDLRKENLDEAGTPNPLPLSQVLTYVAEILPALGYLHQQGLLFCDFKPDNVIHVESWLKLIDLGAVRRLDDEESAVFGTPGYAVTDDEIINHGPSVSSDLYTVARAAAVLAFDFHGFTGEYRNRMPEPHTEPLFARYDAFYRLLARATHPDVAYRFSTADEFRDQLVGVRQEVLSLERGYPHGHTSGLFTPEQSTFGAPDAQSGAFEPLTGADITAALPLPLVDSDDPSAGFLATLTATDPMDILYELKNAPENSPEVRMRRVRANIAYGNLKAASMNLDEYAATGVNDWRVAWWRGLIALLNGDAAAAREQFDWLYGHLPGEIAPVLALAAACEILGDTSQALGIYSRIWATDRRYVSAGFGQARLLAHDGHHDPSIAVLDAVPGTSSQYNAAQVAAIGLRLADHPAPPGMDRVRDAAERLSHLKLPGHHHHLLTARILLACLRSVSNGTLPPQPPILKYALDEKSLRFGLEYTYRELARTSSAHADRVRYIDEANKIRPWTIT
ncbi:MAG TPA: tetratricopeptide repeat protein [Stackebrandtia sp.]|uniref:serine/threonine-protein kinase n=1 Tax=Stackebrandtia sp. TaxID=2023065 RepID=UPI002D316FFE|nr:tetratricopeptide repeat protein [Stackebrandtia sp.]HZE37861.1 tetratricopeptide repeat protein [Stackebrandtia sp.]